MGRVVNPDTGKRPIVFNIREGFSDMPSQVPCGRCLGCRIDRSRQWAVRCVHEASLHDENCFITLTFNDKFLPSNGSLVKSDFQLFIKRLRKRFFGNSKSDVRYFHCGEYGEKLGRPHHHACLFGFNFPDRVLFREKEGFRLYRSEILESLWSHPRTGESFGFCSIGDVSFESAAYVARYIVKKISGDLAPGHYQGRLPEFTTMSRRPGIGRDWFESFKGDLYPKDFVVIHGRKYKIPKYYDRCYEATNPVEYGCIKASRCVRGRSSPDNTFERLSVREEVQRMNLSLLKRGYESAV